MLILGLVAAFAVSACTTSGKKPFIVEEPKEVAFPTSERACLERAMFFEANRSSRDGLIAVGTVVMNRVNSSHYPNTICGVVGQRKQFAPGVLTRKMDREKLLDVREAADAVLRGERHPKLKNAMFFHTAGLSFPYDNMHYTLVAGGNAFYEKRRKDGSLRVVVGDAPYDVALAFAQERQGIAAHLVEPDVEMDVDSIITAGLVPVQQAEQEAMPMEREETVAESVPIPSLRPKPDVTLAFSNFN